jgi:hypothetical protein
MLIPSCAFFFDTKADRKLKSFQDTRKHRDAMLWGSKVADEPTPQTFYEKTDIFLESHMRRNLSMKRKLATPTNMQLAQSPCQSVHELLLKWSIETSNVFAWFCWTATSWWNFMAPSASINPLGFHNFHLGVDSIIGKHDNLKVDKIGERLSEKNIFANPLNWHVCWWTGTGICCAVFAVDLEKHE